MACRLSEADTAAPRQLLEGLLGDRDASMLAKLALACCIHPCLALQPLRGPLLDTASTPAGASTPAVCHPPVSIRTGTCSPIFNTHALCQLMCSRGYWHGMSVCTGACCSCIASHSADVPFTP